MGKYLHRYLNREDLHETYDDSATTIITAVTCSSGTFVYDRYVAGGRVRGYIWKNGDQEIATEVRNPYNKEARDTEHFRVILNELLTESHTPKYNEPWVSYTTYNVNTEISGELRYEYNGEVVGSVVLKYKGVVDAEVEDCV
jgi:hypothetical protein